MSIEFQEEQEEQLLNGELGFYMIQSKTEKQNAKIVH